MEPSQVSFLANAVLTFGAPFAAFALGVLISIKVGLNEETPVSHIWWMALPVCFVLIGTLLTTTAVSVEIAGARQSYYGHMATFPQFILFNGTIVFYGTLVPQLFHLNRSKLQKDASEDDQITAPIKPSQPEEVQNKD